MMIWENLKMAFDSLRNAKLRSFLTMLGIIIGVGAVVAILAIGQGLKATISKQVSDLGSNVIVVTSGKVIDTSKPKGGKVNPAASAGTSTLSQKDVDAIAKVDGISKVAQISLISGSVTHDTAVDNGSLIIATSASFNDIHTQKFAEGMFFNDSQDTDKVVVLGASAKTTLFGTASAIGQTVQLKSTKLTVVGTIAPSDTGTSLGGPSLDDAIYLPVGTAKAITGGTLQIFRIMAQANSAGDVDPAIVKVKSVMLANHDNQDDFSVLTQKDLLSTINTILDLLTNFIVAIASISLLVGGIGIMNIMLVSVTERTREIGLRKALGASSRTVLTQFLIEAMVLSLLGGALGCLLAVGTSILGGHLVHITPVFTSGEFAVAFGVSAAVGIIFGIAPAVKAARMRPIQALKFA